jgi:hypothetical protein
MVLQNGAEMMGLATTRARLTVFGLVFMVRMLVIERRV